MLQVVDVIIETEVPEPDDPSLPYSWRLARRRKTHLQRVRIPDCTVELNSSHSGEIHFEGRSLGRSTSSGFSVGGHVG